LDNQSTDEQTIYLVTDSKSQRENTYNFNMGIAHSTFFITIFTIFFISSAFSQPKKK